ncbi:MAG: hypothetical protein OEQ53_03755 [Saprospiraceae bacterium]|nr:hypothetical protein [Saprospiraceae bacterium]
MMNTITKYFQREKEYSNGLNGQTSIIRLSVQVDGKTFDKPANNFLNVSLEGTADLFDNNIDMYVCVMIMDYLPASDLLSLRHTSMFFTEEVDNYVEKITNKFVSESSIDEIIDGWGGCGELLRSPFPIDNADTVNKYFDKIFAKTDDVGVFMIGKLYRGAMEANGEEGATKQNRLVDYVSLLLDNERLADEVLRAPAIGTTAEQALQDWIKGYLYWHAS